MKTISKGMRASVEELAGQIAEAQEIAVTVEYGEDVVVGYDYEDKPFRFTLPTVIIRENVEGSFPIVEAFIATHDNTRLDKQRGDFWSVETDTWLYGNLLAKDWILKFWDGVLMRQDDDYWNNL